MFTNTLKLLLLALLLGACTAEPSAPTAAPSSTPLPAPSKPAVTALADTVEADLSGVPDSLRSCVPPALARQAVRFEYVGSMSPDGAPQEVLLEYFDPEDPMGALDFNPVILDVNARGCTSGSELDSDADFERAYLLLTSPEIAAQSARLHVDAAGGADAYGELYRSYADQNPRECGPGESPLDDGCFGRSEAAAYRTLGVSVD